MLRKNDFVTNSKKPDWGVGIVTEEQRNGDIKVFFENNPRIVNLRQSTGLLNKVDNPGASKLFLENCLVGDRSAGVAGRKPFTDEVARFLEAFKGGLHGPVLEEKERKYKQGAHDAFVSMLNHEEYQKLMANGSWSELADRIKKLYAINLLSKFEAIKISDALKSPDAQEDIARGLFDFLYGDELLSERFGRYAKTLAFYECDKWPTITLPLFLSSPSKYMFVKPTMTREAAENRGFDIQYSSDLNWNTYQRVLLFSEDLFQRLLGSDNPQLHPRDMIDVQTFMWCTFTDGWTADEISQAEKEVALGAQD